MPHFSTKRVVELTADQAFSIAADVGSYKDFLPLLGRSALRGPRTQAGEEELFTADLQIAYEKLGFRETFTSQVTTNAVKRNVIATSSDGPLKSLKAVWQIVELSPNKSEVSITVDYALKNAMLQLVAGGMMDFAAQKILSAFEERGRVLFKAFSSDQLKPQA
jgi:coenzyme Q-binding protein COQ10